MFLFQSFNETKHNSKETGWWFQPIWKIWVKLDHFPKYGRTLKNIWNHHPGNSKSQNLTTRNVANQPLSQPPKPNKNKKVGPQHPWRTAQNFSPTSGCQCDSKVTVDGSYLDILATFESCLSLYVCLCWPVASVDMFLCCVFFYCSYVWVFLAVVISGPLSIVYGNLNK